MFIWTGKRENFEDREEGKESRKEGIINTEGNLRGKSRRREERKLRGKSKGYNSR